MSRYELAAFGASHESWWRSSCVSPCRPGPKGGGSAGRAGADPIRWPTGERGSSSEWDRRKSIRFIWLIFAASGFSILCFTFFPLASVYLAATVAEARGCTLSEVNAFPCHILGYDWGGLLYGMAFMGWLAIGTLPIGAMLGAGWLIALAVFLILRLIMRRGRS